MLKINAYLQPCNCGEYGPKNIYILKFTDTDLYRVSCGNCCEESKKADTIEKAIQEWNTQHRIGDNYDIIETLEADE